MRGFKHLFVIFLFLSLYLLPASAAAEHEKGASLETDPEVFSLIVQVANWDIPNGYRMRGFLRTDLNGDSVTDAIVLLENTENLACTVSIVMSGQDGYQVVSGEQTTPYLSMDAGLFAGLNAGADYITLYTRSETGECFENEYQFSRVGSEFSLSKIVTVQWSPDSLDATQNTIDFSSGQQTTQSGTMQNKSFIATSEASYTLSEETPSVPFAFGVPPATQNPNDLPGEPRKAQPEAANRQTDADTQQEGIYCNACGQSFGSGDAFRNHSCVYEPQTAVTFTCDVCGKQFDSNDALFNHQCTPYENELIVCSICGQSFSSEEASQNHLCISYLDDNSVYCDICGGWYAEGEAFRSHLCVP